MLTRMPGSTVALVGSGEFLPAMTEIDAGLLAATGRSPAPRRDPADGVLAGRDEVFQRWASMGVEPLLGARRRGRAGPRPRSVRRRRRGPRPGDRRGRPDLPVGRQAGHLTVDARRVGGRRGAGRGARAGRGAGRLLGRGDDPRRAPLVDFRRRRLFWPLRWHDGPGARAGRDGHPALRRVPRADGGAARPPGAARPRDPRHRRGDGGRRPGRLWQVHGRWPGHGLARPPPRALPARATCSASDRGDRRAGPRSRSRSDGALGAHRSAREPESRRGSATPLASDASSQRADAVQRRPGATAVDARHATRRPGDWDRGVSRSVPSVSLPLHRRAGSGDRASDVSRA